VLIYRAMFEVADPTFAASDAPTRFESWLANKLRNEHDPAGGELATNGVRFDWSAIADSDADLSAFRGHLYEDRGAEQVRTTFTAATPADGAPLVWTDVERWTADQFSQGWIPYAPRLVTTILQNYDCSDSGIGLRAAVEVINRDDVDDLLRRLFDPARTVPIVVVSPTKWERDNDITPAFARATELYRRLAGVALVVTLGQGATSALSRAMVDAISSSYDVHSGAVRTYLPGLGSPGDYPRRHRLVPFHRLEGRPPETAARLISLPLVQASCLQQPPAVWQEATPKLKAFVSGAETGKDMEELVNLAEQERDAALADAAESNARRAEDRETTDELLASLDTLQRRISYLETELSKQDPTALYRQPNEEIFEPEWCEEVAQHIGDLPDLAVSGDIATAAGELDVHADSASWARKSWRALRALNAYAEDKLAGKASGWDFKLWCAQSGNVAVIPGSWVAMHETATTDNNPKFRRLRTLPVDKRISASGTVYMPAHIKIEQGGTPCPRIHFHDDLDGATAKIHIGWFGDHLDSGAKS
jgi:hypothetical protein